MNYEDRTDLVAPEQVISAALLSKLQGTPDATVLITRALESTSADVSPSSRTAMMRRAAEDTAPGRGAPAEARAVEEDAMLCGYRFGRLALGSALRGATSGPDELHERAEAMYLYDLLVWDTASTDIGIAVRAVLARHEGEEVAALDDAAGWAWAYGLGIALAEVDLDAAHATS